MWVGVLEVPLGEGGQFGGGFDDADDLAPGEQLDAAAVAGDGAGACAFGPFGQAAQLAVVLGEQCDDLAGLGPVDQADSDGLVFQAGH